MHAKLTHKTNIGHGWASCTGWLEIPITGDAYAEECGAHEHIEVMWLEHEGTRATAYLGFTNGAEYDEEPVEDKQWSHEWAENMREHWLTQCGWKPTAYNKLQ